METGHNAEISGNRVNVRHNYDKMSRFYDYFAGIFEENCISKGLEKLHLREGEKVLDIGFGTGIGLEKIAQNVGKSGKASGIDISQGMMDEAKKRLIKSGLDDHVELQLGDAAALPWKEDEFDAVFMSFTLELFETSEIPLVLKEVKRVIKYGGRVAIVSLSKDYGQTIPMSVYEWLHKKFPVYLDCRPINVEKSITDAGLEICHLEQHRLFGLPVAICVGEKTAAGIKI